MKESDMNSTSETDWDLIDSLTDEAIDRPELPPLDEFFFTRAKWRILIPHPNPPPLGEGVYEKRRLCQFAVYLKHL